MEIENKEKHNHKSQCDVFPNVLRIFSIRPRNGREVLAPASLFLLRQCQCQQEDGPEGGLRGPAQRLSQTGMC